MLIMKTKKNIKKKNNKKKSMKGGAGAMMQQAIKTTAGDDTCDLSLDYSNLLEKSSYIPEKMLKKAEGSEFLRKENPQFKKMFSVNLRAFCGSSKGNRYLKFCTNIFSCIKEPILLYEVLNDIFDLNIKKQPKLKALFKKKQNFIAGLSIDDFYKKEKEDRAETMAMFLVKALFRTINQYEQIHPPTNKSPTETIFLKEKILLVFENVGLNIDIKKESVEDLKQKILKQEGAITDYYSSRIFSTDDEQGIREMKDKKNGSFIFIVVGLFLSTLALQTNFFDAPPSIGGSVT